MWWIPITISVAWLLKEILTDDASNQSRYEAVEQSILEKNFIRLGQSLESERGTSILIMGQPGAGKSSIVDQVTDYKSIPRPRIGQFTDATDWSTDITIPLFSKYNGIRFIDTPGYDTKNHPAESYIARFPFSKVDKAIFVVKGKVREADDLIFKQLVSRLGAHRILLVRSYADNLSDSEKHEISSDLDLQLKFKRHNVPLVFLSNRFNFGIVEIKNFIS